MIPLTSIGAAFLAVALVLIFALPQRYALVPLLVGTCYMTLAQGIKVGPVDFFCIRILIAAAFARAFVRGEYGNNSLNGIDQLMLFWSAWIALSSVFYDNAGEKLISNLGLVYNTCGIYFLVRIYCKSPDDIVRMFRVVSLLLVPVALEMLAEQMTQHNLFSVLGGVSPEPQIREDRLRAQGPFAHPILAGTVGAVCLPFAIGLWHRFKATSVLGTFACLAMAVSSASSGPVMSALFALLALAMWRWRQKLYLVRRAFVGLYLVLALTMSAPVYYLLARIDVAGGSTGWHRARLIEAAIEHFDEWWFVGTNFTRHWMLTGVSWSWDHTDITNHYIQLGVVGGLPLMLLFVASLWLAFRRVGRHLQTREAGVESGFVAWALGSSLFAHAATSMSVSYFDQSFVFLYVTLACIAALEARPTARLTETADAADLQPHLGGAAATEAPELRR